MKINKPKFKKDIFESIFNSNYNKCAKSLGLDTPQLHRFINQERSEAGAKLLGCLFSFCDNNDLEFKDYIILPSLSTAVYRMTKEQYLVLKKSA